MIKGRYVALVEVDFRCKESQIKLDTKELRERMNGGWMEEAVSKMVGAIFKGVRGTVKATRQYADLVEVEDETEA